MLGKICFILVIMPIFCCDMPGYVNPGYVNPGYVNPGYVNPGYGNPGYGNPGYGNPGSGGGVQFPSISCPHNFKYSLNNTDQRYFGELALQKPMASYYELEVNMSINAAVPHDRNIKILLYSDQNEVINGNVIRFIVLFPLQMPLPKLTHVKLNGQDMCHQRPDALSTGTQTAMWAKVGLRIGSSGGVPGGYIGDNGSNYLLNKNSDGVQLQDLNQQNNYNN